MKKYLLHVMGMILLVGVLGVVGYGCTAKTGLQVVFQADLSGVPESDEDAAIEGAIAVLQNRIEVLGVAKPVVHRQGNDRILVELSDANITDADIETLGRVDILEFGELASEAEEARWVNELGRWKTATGEINGETKQLTSYYFLSNTFVTADMLGQAVLVFEWNDEGSSLSEQITTRLIDKPLGIFEGTQALLSEDGQPLAPTIRGVITDKGQIEGLSLSEATQLSQQLNYGRLPIPLEVLEVKRYG